ncbi:MAG: hypothetical protein R3C68_19235 [Myxococcota bacterium]
MAAAFEKYGAAIGADGGRMFQEAPVAWGALLAFDGKITQGMIARFLQGNITRKQ